MSKLIKTIGILIMIFCIAPVTIFAFVVTGSPRNLGVPYTDSAYKSGHARDGVTLKNLPENTLPTSSIVQQGQHKVNAAFTSAEITAIAQGATWKYWPFKLVQVKFNSDKSVETSGILVLSKIHSYALAIGVDREIVDKGLQLLKIGFVDVPFYIKGTIEIDNNYTKLNIQEAQLGKIGIPTSIVAQYQPAIANFIMKQLDKSPNIFVRKLEIKDQKAFFDGGLPDVEMTANK